MSSPLKSIRRLSARANRRFRNARPGSVLILVVALLVLMALIGTAWISSARTERYTTKQATNNTHIELLVDGVINQTKAAELADAGGSEDDIKNDGFVASRAPVVLRDICPIWTAAEHTVPLEPAYTVGLAGLDGPRPRKYYEGQIVKWPLDPPPYTDTTDWEYYVCTYTHTFGPLDLGIPMDDRNPPDSDCWRLIGSDATPPPPIDNDTALPPGTERVYGMTPMWPAISRLFGDTRFEDIREPAAGGGHMPFGDRIFVIPTFMTFAGDPKFPAFWIYSSNANPGAGQPYERGNLIKLPAADTDGDGVADALLYRLPVGTLDGLEYTAAVRIVDNNSALNLNTALSNEGDIDPIPANTIVPAFAAADGYMGMFKSHIGLFDWLNADTSGPNYRYREMAAWARWRTGNDAGVTNAWGPNTDIAASNPKAPFTFRSIGEALETDLARRLGNPAGDYRRYSVGEGLSLYYRGGVLRNPDASLSRLQTALSTINVNPTTPAPHDPGFYDPLWDRMPNRGTQIWTSYKDAPSFYGPRRDGTGILDGQHPYDPQTGAPPTAINGGWPSFIWRWFDENYNQWGYTDNSLLNAAHRAPNNPDQTKWPTGAKRLMMGRDDYELTVVPPLARTTVKRGVGPFVVTQNPTSIQAPLKVNAGATIGVNTAPVPTPVGPNPQFMAGFGSVHPRTSVNTAGFQELWRAYWSVMAHNWFPDAVGTGADPIVANHTPFSELYRFARDFALGGSAAAMPGPVLAASGAWHNDPFYGMGFFDSDTATPHQPDTTRQHYARMFRSVLRPSFNTVAAPFGPPTPRMQPDQVLLMRAAIAAINTGDLRDGDDNISVATVRIPASADATRDIGAFSGETSPAVDVTIYGTERQPYITEVYADSNDGPAQRAGLPIGGANANGYVAIELHNPYDVPMDLQYCKIALINRQGSEGTLNANAEPVPGPTARKYAHDQTNNKLVVLDSAIDYTDPTQIIDLSTATSNMQPVGALNWHGPMVIPARGYLVLENYNAGPVPNARAAEYRPPALRVNPGEPEGNPEGIEGGRGLIKTDGDYNVAATAQDPPHATRIETTNFTFVPNLDRILDHEFVLVRPVTATYDTTTPAGEARVNNADVPVLRFGTLADLADNASTMAPMDSFDFTGMYAPYSLSRPAGRAFAWHYVRANRDAAAIVGMGNNGKAWRFVYPGRYDGNKSVAVAGAQRPRHQGTDEAREILTMVPPTYGLPGWDPAAAHPWEVFTVGMGPQGIRPEPGFSLGAGFAQDGGDRFSASYPREFPIQVAAKDFPGPKTAGVGAYPHGGFARDGDILQVTYIGAYKIRLAGQTGASFLEWNTLPMDAAFAEDTDPSDDPLVGDAAGLRRESIGRFAPLPIDLTVAARGTVDFTTDTNTRFLYDDERGYDGVNRWSGLAPQSTFYDMVITSGPAKGRSRTIGTGGGVRNAAITPWAQLRTDGSMPKEGVSYEIRRGNYRWATDLFDHLTVHNPALDFMPDNVSVPIAARQPISNNGADANSAAEINASKQGLININTASWRVLASLPLTPNTDVISYNDLEQEHAAAPGEHVAGKISVLAGNRVPDNYDLARAIVAYRDAEIAAGADPNHVFTSIFDLYRVPGVLLYSDARLAAGEPGDAAGDISPLGADLVTGDLDGVRFDFEEQYLFLNRISNLITTRSDSFTNYILVQGWRGLNNGVVGDEELVVQRRRGYITDRSGVTAGSREVPLDFFFNE